MLTPEANPGKQPETHNRRWRKTLKPLMVLQYEFSKATRTIHGLAPEDRRILTGICADIQRAEKALNKVAQELLLKCTTACTGICCRNIRLDEIIGFYDFVFILTVESGLRPDMELCLSRESLFSADCIFLENGQGPCMFPATTRPRRCLTAFCFDAAAAKQEIRKVNREFNRLARFLLYRRILSIASRLRVHR